MSFVLRKMKKKNKNISQLSTDNMSTPNVSQPTRQSKQTCRCCCYSPPSLAVVKKNVLSSGSGHRFSFPAKHSLLLLWLLFNCHFLNCCSSIYSLECVNGYLNTAHYNRQHDSANCPTMTRFKRAKFIPTYHHVNREAQQQHGLFEILKPQK